MIQIDAVRNMDEIIEVQKKLGNNIKNIYPIKKGNVYRGDYNGIPVVIKKAESLDRALTEFNNQQKANILLKDYGLRVPKVICVENCFIVSEFIDGKNGQLKHEELQKSLDWLRVLHSEDVKNDYYKYFGEPNNHYYGTVLINRLKDEKNYLDNVIEKHQEFSCFKEDFERIYKIAINYAKSDDTFVIGHGDFKPDNIIVHNAEIVPVDWIDFGKVLKWYDLGNLLFGQNKNNLPRLVEYYLQQYPFVNVSKIIERSLSIAFIIQAGSHFRHACNIDDISEDIIAVKRKIDYINSL